MTPYTLPDPSWIHEERNLNSGYTIPVFTGGQMQAAYAAGAASRDSEVEALRADAESWRKHKARKDAVIAAGMGRNPFREDV